MGDGNALLSGICIRQTGRERGKDFEYGPITVKKRREEYDGSVSVIF